MGNSGETRDACCGARGATGARGARGATGATGAACDARPATGLARVLGKGVWLDNPICYQALGLCSAIAVTDRLDKTLLMCAAMVIVLSAGNFIMSLLRAIAPRGARFAGEVVVVVTLVTMVDQAARAFFYAVSEQLGPYLGLIIANCIILRRAEACAVKKCAFAGAWDGLLHGVGYSIVLLLVAAARELGGAGALCGRHVMPPWATSCKVLLMPAGAFFILALLVWFVRYISPARDQE